MAKKLIYFESFTTTSSNAIHNQGLVIYYDEDKSKGIIRTWGHDTMQVILDASQLLVFPWGKMAKVHLPLGIPWRIGTLSLFQKTLQGTVKGLLVASQVLFKKVFGLFTGPDDLVRGDICRQGIVQQLCRNRS